MAGLVGRGELNVKDSELQQEYLNAQGQSVRREGTTTPENFQGSSKKTCIVASEVLDALGGLQESLETAKTPQVSARFTDISGSSTQGSAACAEDDQTFRFGEGVKSAGGFRYETDMELAKGFRFGTGMQSVEGFRFGDTKEGDVFPFIAPNVKKTLQGTISPKFGPRKAEGKAEGGGALDTPEEYTAKTKTRKLTPSIELPYLNVEDDPELSGQFGKMNVKEDKGVE